MKKKILVTQHRVRGALCSSYGAAWKQMTWAEAVFHGCFKASPGSLFVTLM